MNELLALIAVVAVDVALSLDNAVLISAVAEDVPEQQRSRVKLYGIAGAVVARIVFALAASWILKLAFATALGGAYLVKVAWDMWRKKEQGGSAGSKDWFGPVARIIVADVVMSMDNVLAVAHNARQHSVIMCFGIVLSIVLMFLATNLVSLVLKRWPKSYYVACCIVAATGLHMVWHGALAQV
jgi:YjbE family integral membrane protein